MSEDPVPQTGLLALYDRALPQVYGYLRARCDSQTTAEDLSAETFLAAVDAERRTNAPPIDLPWLIGVARHKLVDHWRRRARETRGMELAAPGPAENDPWDAELDAIRARDVLAALGPHHRAALTLRYVDDLPVAEVAALLGRTLHATEGLLVRARSAFRRAYDAGEESDRA
ncbi:MAG: RNA polymerase sigma factor [Jatrophihabitantaceae bacterium]